MLKKLIVELIGRERANRVSAPYHDWQARRRTRAHLAQLPPKDLLINLGCGPVPMKGWVNVDIARGPQIDVVWDVRRGLPFADESCAVIFSEHVIEHLSKEDALKLLSECHRVLEPGGRLRLSTPDAARFLRSYAGDGEFLRHPQFTQAVETPLERVQQMMREGGQHLWVYDAPSLRLLLQRAGFSESVEQECGVSPHPRLQNIDTPARAFESFYVEAVK